MFDEIIVREYQGDYESLKMYLSTHFPCYQPLKSDDLTCGAIVKVSGVFYVYICRSAFEKLDRSLFDVCP